MKINKKMTEREIIGNLMEYACDVLTFEERRSIPLSKWEQFVRSHFRPIPKSELEVGKTYRGNCRNTSKATWLGSEFVYKRYKFGDVFDETINHYEDDDCYDLFVPIETDLIINKDE